MTGKRKERERKPPETSVEGRLSARSRTTRKRGSGTQPAGPANRQPNQASAEEQLHALHEIAVKFSEASTMTEVLPICLATAMRISGMDCGGVYLVNRQSGALELAIHEGISSGYAQEVGVIKADSDSMRLISSSGIIFNLFDKASAEVCRLMALEGLLSGATVPFRYQGKLVACVSLGSHTLSRPKASAKKALEAFAAQTGSAIARVQAEDELRRSEAQLRLLLRASEDIIVLQDLDGRYLFYNAPDRYGLSGEDVVGRYPRDLFDASTAESLLSHVRQVATTGRTIQYEDILAWKGVGESFHSLACPIHSPDGAVISVATVSRNVTERTETERLIRMQRDSALQLAACASTEAALPLCLDMMLTVSGIDGGGIYLLDEAADELVLHCWKGLSQSFADAVTRVAITSDWGRVGMSGQPWYCSVDELEHDLQAGIVDEGLLSIAALPLLHQARVIGCVSLASRSTAELAPVSRDTVELLAAQLGDAVGRVRSREALFESEETTRALLDATSDYAVLMDSTGRVLAANAAMVERLGTTMSGVTGAVLFDLLSPEVAAGRRGLLDEVLRTGQGIARQDIDGKSAIRSYVYPVKDRQGHVTRVAVFARDITEEQAAQRALLQSEARYRSLIETSPDAIIVTDPEGRVTLCNRQALAMQLMDSLDQMLGKSLLDLVPSSDIERVQSVFGRLFETRYIRDVECCLVRRDGTCVPAEISAALVRDEQGRPTAIICTARDITARKRSEMVQLVFSQVNQDLASAHTYDEIGEIIRTATERLWSWDAFHFAVRKSGAAWFKVVLLMDTVDGTKTVFQPIRPGTDYSDFPPVMRGEALLMEFEDSGLPYGLEPFGHVSRPSTSMIYVPIRSRGLVSGVFSIQSYEPHHFHENDRELLLRLADTVGPSLERCRFENQSLAFASLGERLNAVQSPVDAARIAVETAYEMLGWDSCFLDFYVPEDDTVTTLLIVDTVDGLRKEDAEPASLDPQPSAMMRRVIANGPQIILRRATSESESGLLAFGTKRRSESLLFAPVRSSTGVIGMLSIQSYAENAYAEDDLDVLQALADHCAGALERTRVELEHARLATAVEAAAESIVIADTDWRILYVNPAFENVTGYMSAEVLGKSPREVLYSGLQDDRFFRQIDETVSQGRIWSGHISSRRKSGNVLEEDVTIAPMWDSIGVISSYVSVRRDLTREMYMEKELLHSHKLEVVGRLVSGIAHDFNNILHVTMGCSQVLLSRIPAGGPEREQLDSIIRAAKRGARITSQLLAFSHKQVLRPRLLNLNSVVANVRTMVEQLVGSQVDLVINLDPLLGIVNADPGQMELVIMNLATNARDAMQQGGTLSITTTNVSIDATSSAFRHSKIDAGNYVMVMVSDTGHGMDAGTRARIFEPFFTTKEAGKGTGLGLSTVHGVVTQSGGSIGVSSVIGKGTAFKIYLPRVEEPSAAYRASEHAGVTRGGETILVVEDEIEIRKLAVAALTAFGYSVLEASNGNAAVELVASHPEAIHLVLTDILMPGIDGWELVRRLRALRPAMKAIYMSGYLDNQLVADVMRTGDATFIQKPFDPDLLGLKIREVLDSPGSSWVKLPVPDLPGPA